MSAQGYSIMVVGVVPAHLEKRLVSGKLVPSQLVLDAVGANGLTAGAPEMIPVRALQPADAIAAMTRAMSLGQVLPVVAFQLPPQVPQGAEKKSPLVKV